MPLEEGKEEGEGLTLEKLVGSAIDKGIGSLVQNHPKFKGIDLNSYVDEKLRNKYASKFAKKLEKVKDKDREEYVRDFYNTLAGYAASGKLFNEKGQDLVLRTGWRKQARGILPTRGKREAKELLKGEEYLDGVIASVTKLYNLMTEQGYAEKMPEIAKAVDTIYRGGFWKSTLDLLYSEGKLDKGRYLTLNRAVRGKVEAGEKMFNQYLDHYLSQAAVVFGGIGLVVILSILLANGITGNVIGITSGSSLPALIFGGVALIAGIFLWVKRKK